MASKFPAEISADLSKCVICLEEKETMKVLPCRHYFCEKCLRTYIAKTQGTTIFPCPVCKLDVTFPSEGVRGFPTRNLEYNTEEHLVTDPYLGNYAIQQQFVSGDRFCDKCELRHASFICLDCDKCLCQQCQERQHRGSAMQNHRLIEKSKGIHNRISSAPPKDENRSMSAIGESMVVNLPSVQPSVVPTGIPPPMYSEIFKTESCSPPMGSLKPAKSAITFAIKHKWIAYWNGGKFRKVGTFRVPICPSDLIALDNSLVMSIGTEVNQYSPRGQILRQFVPDPHHPFLAPKGIACLRNGYIAIADSEAANLKIFTKNSNFVKTILDNQVSQPNGIAVTKEGNIVITDTDTKQVFVYDDTGQHLLMTLGHKFGCPDYVAVVDDKIIVSDSKEQCLVGFNSYGNICFQYDGNTKHKYPDKVCIELDGKLLVADSINDQIQVLEPHLGSFYTTLATPQGLDVSKPFLVATNKFYKTIVVVEEDGQVKMFSTVTYF